MQHSLRILPLVIACVAAACRGAERSRAPATSSSFRGVILSPPPEKPDFTLTDANGQPFNFRLQTAGKVTLLFFGYTHCPDVCPLHAANVAAVLRRMPFDERDAIRFVFVTTDPERDTPARLKAWLGNFDPSFVGLTGPTEEISRVQASLQMAPSRREVVGGDSANYFVGHAAQVLAFSKDGFARVEYPFGIRQEDWANDLPLLARGVEPVFVPASPAPSATDSAAATSGPPGVHVPIALVPLPASTDEAAVYASLLNLAPNDTLVGVWSPFAREAAVHASVRDGDVVRMSMLDRVPVPASGSFTLAPGAVHVMLLGLRELPAVGTAVPVTLRFAKSGDVIFAATVVPYADVERMLTQRRGR